MIDHCDFWKFVEDNLRADPAALRLKYRGQGRELEIVQIECRQKFGKKLAAPLAENPRLLFPSTLAGEQATSGLLAEYHASLIEPQSQDKAASIVDLTAGLGIDAMRLARRCRRLVAIDMDPDKAAALACNFESLGLDNCETICTDCREFTTLYDGERFDYAFIDPARRAADESRLFALTDCSPDVASMLPAISRIARRLIVKASPMLDISRMASELPGVATIIALGTPTECKELVAVIDLDHPAQCCEIRAVTIFPSGESCCFSFTQQQERGEICEASAELVKPGSYLYEPYPAVMKAGPFCLLASRYGLQKLHPNTNLYCGQHLIEGFPGEVFEIIEAIPYESKHIKRLSKKYPAIRVATRNFDVSAEALRKKLGVKDGGERRLFAVTLWPKQKAMIIV